MNTMSLYESRDSTGVISLEDLINGKITSQMTDEVDLKRIIELIARGGWPASIGLPIENAQLLPKEYIKTNLMMFLELT